MAYKEYLDRATEAARHAVDYMKVDPDFQKTRDSKSRYFLLKVILTAELAELIREEEANASWCIAVLSEMPEIAVMEVPEPTSHTLSETFGGSLRATVLDKLLCDVLVPTIEYAAQVGSISGKHAASWTEDATTRRQHWLMSTEEAKGYLADMTEQSTSPTL